MTTSNLPAITGPALIKLLKKDGWVIKRRGNHGLVMIKKFKDRTRPIIEEESNPGFWTPEGMDRIFEKIENVEAQKGFICARYNELRKIEICSRGGEI